MVRLAQTPISQRRQEAWKAFKIDSREGKFIGHEGHVAVYQGNILRAICTSL